MRDTARNASGDLFEVWRRDGTWYAQQITGVSGNYLGIPALLHADTRAALFRDLSHHWSNT